MKLSIQLRTLFLLAVILLGMLSITMVLVLQLAPLARQVLHDGGAVNVANANAAKTNPTTVIMSPTETPTATKVSLTVLLEVTVAPRESHPTQLPTISQTPKPPSDTFAGGENATESATPRPRAIITGDLVNVRSAPSAAGEIVAQLSANQEVEVLGTSADGEWYRICCPPGTYTNEAWVSANLMRMVVAPTVTTLVVQSVMANQHANTLSARRALTQPQQAGQQLGIVSAAVVNIRTGPGTNYPVIGQVTDRTKVTVVGRSEQSNWLHLCCLDTSVHEGWISAEFVELTSNNDAINRDMLLAALAVPPTPVPPTPMPHTPAEGSATALATNGSDGTTIGAAGLPGQGNFGGVAAQNPLTGLPLATGHAAQRPMIICINNDPAARPQLGLSQADVIYEYLMEGYGITRFSAIFYGNDVAAIGPVRSARLINYYMGALYDAGLVCSGASDQVRYALKHEAPFPYLDIDLDDPSNSRYSVSIGSDYRTRLRTSTSGARQWLADWGVEKSPNLRGFTFGERRDGNPATQITIPYPQGTGSAVSYRYDNSMGQYLRWLGGNAHTDGNNGTQIVLDNVIVQYVTHEATNIVEDSLGSTSIRLNLFGSGRAIVFRNGVALNGSWRSESRGDTPRFYTDDGQEIALKTGRSWISIVPESYTISYQ